jgi:CHASE3 domain sensor protein/GAF domain-containing protein
MTTNTSTDLSPAQDSQTADGTRPVGTSFLNRLNIGRKLTLGFSTLVFLAFLIVGLSYLGSAAATEKINDTDKLRVPVAITSANAQANLLAMLASTRGYLALGDPRFIEEYNVAQQSFQTNLDQLGKLRARMNPENQQRLDELEVLLVQWKELPGTLFELRDDQLEREPAYSVLAIDGSLLAGQVLIDIESMIESQAQREPTAENVALLKNMATFQGTFASMLSGLRGYVTTRNRIYRQEYEVNLTANDFAWERLNENEARLTANQRALLANIAQNRENFLELPEEEIFPVLEGERWRQDLYLYSTEAVPLGDQMLQLLNEMTANQQQLLQNDLATGNRDLANARNQTLSFGALALVVGATMAYIFRGNIAGPVRRLTDVAEQIGAGDLEAQARVESGDEIGILAQTFNKMTSQIRQTLQQVRKEKSRADNLLNVVIPIGVELSSEKDFNQLLEKMLVEAKAFCNADAGSLYLRTEDDQLRFVSLHNDAQNIALGGTTGEEVPYAPIPLYRESGDPNRQSVAAQTTLSGQSINVADIYAADTEKFTGTRAFDAETGYHTTSMLSIPLKNNENEVLGVLQLLNAKDPESGQVIPFDPNLQQMMESFSSLAVAALEAYIREQELRQEIQQLRIEIDEVKLQQQVKETVETDFFQDLKAKARDIRRRRQRKLQANEGET